MNKGIKSIIYIGLVILALVAAFIIISKTCIDCGGLGSKKIEIITPNIEEKLDNLLIEQNAKMVIGLEGGKIIEEKGGTENLGVPFAFSPDTPDAWGIDNTRCKYFIEIINQASYCINKGWESPEEDIITGINSVVFDKVKNNVGYAIIKINIPDDIAPCQQRFKITVKCTALTEETKDYFDLKIVNSVL
jgi:hypothetical protein